MEKKVSSGSSLGSMTNIIYPHAFDLQRDSSNEFSVYIIPPFAKLKSYVTIFPRFTFKDLNNHTFERYEHPNYVYYEGKFCKPSQMPGGMEVLFYGFPSEAVKKFKVETYFRLPYSYFSHTTLQQSEFKKNGIQPIKDLLRKYEFKTVDNRGQRSLEARKIRKLRKECIIKAFKESKRIKPLPIKRIQKAWSEELTKISKGNQEMYDSNLVSDSIIRKTLKDARLV